MPIKLLMGLQALSMLSRQYRATERRAFEHAQLLRIHARLSDAGIPKRQMERILKRAKGRTIKLIKRAGIPSDDGKSIIVPMPTPEAEWIEAADLSRSNIYMERTVYLRRELRAGYLAYAFLRGVDLGVLEESCNEPVPLERIEEIVKHYSEQDFSEMNNRFAAWKADAYASVSAGRHPKRTENAERWEQRRSLDKSRARLGGVAADG